MSKYIQVLYVGVIPYVAYWIGGGIFERDHKLGVIFLVSQVVMLITFLILKDMEEE